MVSTYGKADVLQRLKNQSFYHEILLLQKFNDRRGKVLELKRKKEKEKQPPTSEKKETISLFFD